MMDKKRIEEIRKTLNIDDRLQLDFVEKLGLWIIGEYGPVDIQEEFSKRLLSIPDYAKIEDAFRPYITSENAAEGYNVYKFEAPYLDGRDIKEVEIYFILCINNGISYFSCSNLAILRAFVDKENNK